MLRPQANPRPGATASRRAGDSALVLGALGVVFGDIGTSPIYALRQAVSDAGVVNVQVVMGVLSMIVWAVVIVVMLKYAWYVLRADNEGEGGIIALTALVRSGYQRAGRRVPRALLLAGLFGAAMFYGDSMITPAVSVLSAVEGLQEIDPGFGPWVVPIAAVILVALFAFQRRGSSAVGRTFGPVMAVWFVSLAALGVYRIVQHPQVLRALSPLWAWALVVQRRQLAFTILGAVILALTGAEALYADIGHFGRNAIRIALLVIVFPAIVLGYFGQAATLLYDPGSFQQPFFHAAPAWALVPTVAIAMLATIIASQAVISGAFSMTSQAIELGFLPRVQIVETSKRQHGQVYSPAVNAVLFVAVLCLVLVAHSSARLTSAYGIAVALTMSITTLQMISVSHNVWRWPLYRVALVSAPLLALDLTLVAANVPKIASGGWFPIAVGLLLFVLMSTWNRGRELGAQHAARAACLDAFLREALAAVPGPARVPGTAVYPGNRPGVTPAAFVSNLRHNHVLHQTTIFFTDIAESAPRIDERSRIETRELGDGCYEIVARHGFVERPDLPRLLASLSGRLGDWRYDAARTTYFLPRDEAFKGRSSRGMMRWRKALFGQMSFHSAPSAEYYGLRAEDVVELGVQVAL
jgi:KUP system potassium uptake protein